ncbi:MAG: energy-coupling factor transporter transmembrane protein EcfT [Firmicutes bacterium]|nr:energy-coupling factor transporter transmembrane protein EcfT [Bacillota bacterium]
MVKALLNKRLLIGQYYPASSPLHKLDARSKIIVTVLYMIALFVAQGWPAYAFMTIIFAVAVGTARIPFSSLLRGMKLIIIFVLLTVVMNGFFSPGDIIWSWRSFNLTRQGLIMGAAMGLRLLLLVSFASLLTLTTEPLALTDGLEKLLKPAGRIGIPSHEIAMMMSIALRFIPTILEEFDRIVLAQRARGATIAQGNIAKRITAMMPLLVPLFVAAFRRADELAQAMEAKCYHGGEGRSRWRQSRWQAGDTAYTAFFCLILAGMIFVRVLNPF